LMIVSFFRFNVVCDNFNVVWSHTTLKLCSRKIPLYAQFFRNLSRTPEKWHNHQNAVQLTIGEQDDTIRRDKFLYHTITDVSIVLQQHNHPHFKRLSSTVILTIILMTSQYYRCIAACFLKWPCKPILYSL